jgi:hypothetical protein
VKLKLRPAKNPAVSVRVRSAIRELRALHRLLQSDDIDPRLLSEFRDALNRVRNAAWAAQQCTATKLLEKNPTNVGSLLAAERVRAAYHLCRALREDLEGGDAQFQKGQLAELYAVAEELTGQLKKKCAEKDCLEKPQRRAAGLSDHS